MYRSLPLVCLGLILCISVVIPRTESACGDYTNGVCDCAQCTTAQKDPECNYNNVTTVTCLTPSAGTFTSAQAWCKRSSSGSCYACSGCTEGQVCAQQGTSNTGECVTWTCNPRWYNDGSVCDCGCGAVDPDCALTKPSDGSVSLNNCNGTDDTWWCNQEAECYQCASGCDIASGVKLCVDPENDGVGECIDWECGAEFYNDGTYCNCDCGSLDPDCWDKYNTLQTAVTGCNWCSPSGACTSCNDLCDNTAKTDLCMDPDSNALGSCVYWTCDDRYYYSELSDASLIANAMCDCDCGNWDPDCDTLTSFANGEVDCHVVTGASGYYKYQDTVNNVSAGICYTCNCLASPWYCVAPDDGTSVGVCKCDAVCSDTSGEHICDEEYTDTCGTSCTGSGPNTVDSADHDCNVLYQDNCNNWCTGTGEICSQTSDTYDCGTLFYDACGNTCYGTGEICSQTSADTDCGSVFYDTCGNTCVGTGEICSQTSDETNCGVVFFDACLNTCYGTGEICSQTSADTECGSIFYDTCGNTCSGTGQICSATSDDTACHAIFYDACNNPCSGTGQICSDTSYSTDCGSVFYDACDNECVGTGPICSQTSDDYDCGSVFSDACDNPCSGTGQICSQTSDLHACGDEFTDACDNLCTGTGAVCGSSASSHPCGETYEDACANPCVGTGEICSQTSDETNCGVVFVDACDNTCYGTGEICSQTSADTDCGSVFSDACDNECVGTGPICSQTSDDYDCGSIFYDTCDNSCYGTGQICSQTSDSYACGDSFEDACLNDCTGTGEICGSSAMQHDCGIAFDDTCGNPCVGTGEICSETSDNTECGSVFYDNCGNACVGTGPSCEDSYLYDCGDIFYDTCDNACVGTGTKCPAPETQPCGDIYYDECGYLCEVGTGCEGENYFCTLGECTLWLCNISWFNGGDGCDCNCGSYDPDCAGPYWPDHEVLYECERFDFWCSSEAQCYGCYAENNTCAEDQVCAYDYETETGACSDWNCPLYSFQDGSDCDCECLTYDPDCEDRSTDLINCESDRGDAWCNRAGTCFYCDTVCAEGYQCEYSDDLETGECVCEDPCSDINSYTIPCGDPYYNGCGEYCGLGMMCVTAGGEAICYPEDKICTCSTEPDPTDYSCGEPFTDACGYETGIGTKCDDPNRHCSEEYECICDWECPDPEIYDCGSPLENACGDECPLGAACGDEQVCNGTSCIPWNCTRGFGYGDWNGDDGCDCECLSYDPDCDDRTQTLYNCDKDDEWCNAAGHCFTCAEGCDEPGELCFDFESTGEGVCAVWTCDPSYYNSGDGCDCGCGSYDPDCDDPEEDLWWCDEGESCNDYGACYSCPVCNQNAECVIPEEGGVGTCVCTLPCDPNGAGCGQPLVLDPCGYETCEDIGTDCGSTKKECEDGTCVCIDNPCDSANVPCGNVTVNGCGEPCDIGTWCEDAEHSCLVDTCICTADPCNDTATTACGTPAYTNACNDLCPAGEQCVTEGTYCNEGVCECIDQCDPINEIDCGISTTNDCGDLCDVGTLCTEPFHVCNGTNCNCEKPCTPASELECGATTWDICGEKCEIGTLCNKTNYTCDEDYKCVCSESCPDVNTVACLTVTQNICGENCEAGTKCKQENYTCTENGCECYEPCLEPEEITCGTNTSDACGNNCATGTYCVSGEECSDNVCKCKTNCTDPSLMPCGSYYDACGLLCPTNGTVCDKKHVCELGKCVCSRPCDAPEERTCGLAYLDGCGNNCPNKGMLCDDGFSCEESTYTCECTEPCPEDSTSTTACGSTYDDVCGNTCEGSYCEAGICIDGACSCAELCQDPSELECGSSVTCPDDNCVVSGTKCDWGYECENSECVCSEPCAEASSVTCGNNYYDGCGILCVGTGTHCDDGYQCEESGCECSDGCADSSTITCGESYVNGCSESCGEGTGCGEPDQCHEGTGTCNSGICEYLELVNGTTCDDGDNCTTGDNCYMGECSGTSVTCHKPGTCQVSTGQCNPLTGSCVYPIDVGASCNDNDACTGNDTCNAAGACVGVDICFSSSSSTPSSSSVVMQSSSSIIIESNTTTLSSSAPPRPAVLRLGSILLLLGLILLV